MSNILENCPVPILQEPWEFGKLVEIYKAHAPKKVLEIGSFYGGTLWFWTQENAGVLDTLASVDYPIGPSDGRYEEMMGSRAHWPFWMEGTARCFHDIQGDSHNPVTIQRVRQVFPNNDVDFLFIDGDHSYCGVKADYENFAPLVRPGGLIVFHDVCGLPEVAMFWQEVRQGQRAMEICGHPGGWGIGIIEKQ